MLLVLGGKRNAIKRSRSKASRIVIGRVARSLVWSYGTQLLSALAQFGYAAVTSRLVDADGFGTYATALVVVGLFTIVSNGGVGQAIARMDVLDVKRIRGLLAFSIILGIAAGSALFFSASIWSNLWSNDNATTAIRLVSINAVSAPLVGVASGLLRRQGRFKTLGISTLVSTIGGMLSSLVFVLNSASGESLLASPILAQILLLVILASQNRKIMSRLGNPRDAFAMVRFSTNVILLNIVAYVNTSIPRIAVSRFQGPDVLGVWNRGEVLTTIPFFQIQSSVIQVLYPEFRHDINDSRRAFKLWTSLMLVCVGVTFPVVGVMAATVPTILPILLGSEWSVVVSVVPVLSIIGGLQLIATLLASAIEALGRFRWVWVTEIVVFGVQISGVLGGVYYCSLNISLFMIVIGLAVRHSMQIGFCCKHGYLNLRRLTAGYSAAAIVSFTTYGLTYTLVSSMTGSRVDWLLAAWSVLGWIILIASAIFVRQDIRQLAVTGGGRS